MRTGSHVLVSRMTYGAFSSSRSAHTHFRGTPLGRSKRSASQGWSSVHTMSVSSSRTTRTHSFDAGSDRTISDQRRRRCVYPSGVSSSKASSRSPARSSPQGTHRRSAVSSRCSDDRQWNGGNMTTGASDSLTSLAAST
ncbi:hypothetical protein AQJ11_33325 [Streptomyces corchorusii]|uniref:Uncharacterized protein n=1 Tax=Streptomyces corchorusii TaxID=1903 RepID=A0A101PVZ3_STRCK|nr:hypothetical protein AQJ11_33325 [Streptomyces corchorusii]